MIAVFSGNFFAFLSSISTSVMLPLNTSLFYQCAPTLFKTTFTVFNNTVISSQRDWFLTYFISNLIQSWKGVSLLPWICHNPVIPGFTLSLVSRQLGLNFI